MAFMSALFCNSGRICRIPLYKGSWGIEDFEGYRKETVLISMFCYELHERTPDDEPPATL